MYDVYFRLNKKRVVDFLLVLTELFLQGVTAEALQANIDGKLPFLLERGQSVRYKGSSPPTILQSEN